MPTNDNIGQALSMAGISKAFPGVQALQGATLNLATDEIHGLVGENGAGKSTMIKVLAGVYRPDGGTITIGKTAVGELTPEIAHDLGVRFIHQELSLVPHFNVAESVFMAQERTGPLGLRTREMRRAAEAFLRETFGVEISGKTLIRDLTVAQRKLVQITRALIDGNARLVVFDEPTAVLGAEDIELLFHAIRRLRDAGISILYVSHYLSEITEICDRVTIFRNGSDVASIDLQADDTDASVHHDEIIRLMVGREISDLYPERTPQPSGPGITAVGLSDGAQFRDVSFEVSRGEIVGIAGIIGSGREELVDTLYGIRRARAGSIELVGEPVRLRNPSRAVDKGLVLVPRDRRSDGLVLEMSVDDNINLATLDEVSSPIGWLRAEQARNRAANLVERLDVRPPRTNTVARLLSGGNQQKVVLARWLATDARIFLLDDPTVGVDVGARAEIYRLVASLAENAAIVVSSNDPAELLGLCDRILVMVRGSIVADVPTHGLTIDSLVAMTTGSSGQVAS